MLNQTNPSDVLQEFRSQLLRHRRKSLLFFCAVVTGVGLYTLMAPMEYLSQGKLFVGLGRENVALDPTTTLGQNQIVPLQMSRENEINSVVELLQSRALVEKVVDALGANVILDLSAPATDQNTRQRAILKVVKNLGVEAVKKSNVIDVSYRGASPEQCQAILGRVIDSYIDEHLRLNRVHGSHEFLATQTDRLRSDLAQKEAGLRDLKNQTGLASPAAQRNILVARIGRIEDDLLQSQAKQSVAESNVRELRKKIAALPPSMVAEETSGIGNEGTDRMRDQFYALQLKEQEARAKFTEDHPKLQQLHEQIAAARGVLDDEELERKQVKMQPNQLYRQAESSLMNEESILASLKAQTERLCLQLIEVRGDLEKLNANEVRVASLQREVDLLETDYRKYSANLEQSRIDRQLEDQRISNISVAQPASYEPRPIWPKKLLNLLLGLGVGTFGGLALPLVLAKFDSLRPATDESKPKFASAYSIPRFFVKTGSNGNGNGAKGGAAPGTNDHVFK